MAQDQRRGGEDVCWWRRITLAGQDVEHDISGMDTVSGTVRNLVCEAMMMGIGGASYGDRERPVGPAIGGPRSEGRIQQGRPGRRAEEGAVRADFEYRTRRAPGWRRRGRQDQLPQRLFEEVGADRHLEDDVIGAEGSGWPVRPQANCQIPAEVS